MAIIEGTCRHGHEHMGITRRQLGERRWGLPVQYPLIDSNGVMVEYDRRKQCERRKAGLTLEELEILLSQVRFKNRIQ